MSSPALPARNGRPLGAPTFLLALLAGLGLCAAVLGLFHFTVTPFSPPRSPAPVVHFLQTADHSQAELTRDEAELSDPQLLYMFTPAAYATRATPPAASDAKPAITPFPLPLTEDVSKQMGQLSPSSTAPATPADTLKAAQWDALHDMGRTANSSPALPARGAQLRLERLAGPGAPATSADTVEITWPAELAPDAGGALWSRADFTVNVSAAGPGPLLMVKSSDVAKVDADLGKKLQDWLQHHPLPPGFYKIEIWQ